MNGFHMVLHLRDKAEYRKLQLFLDVLAIDDVVMEQVVEDQNAAGRHNAAESSDQDVLLRLREDGVARDLHVAHDLAGAGLHLVHDDIGGSLAMACTIFPARAGSLLVTVMDMIWVEPTPSTEMQASS